MLSVLISGGHYNTKFSQKAFAEKLQLNFPLVSDANRAVSPQLGTMLDEVAGIRQVNFRGVLLIDQTMTLRWKFGMDTASQPDVNQVLEQTRKVSAGPATG